MGLPAIGDRLVLLPLDDKYEVGLNDRPKPTMTMLDFLSCYIFSSSSRFVDL